MASSSALPQPSQPSTNPPTGSLPHLPTPKTRQQSLPKSPEPSRTPSPSKQPTKLRTPSTPRPSLSKSALSNSSSDINAPRSASSSGPPRSPEKSLRRAISVAAFPQPPNRQPSAPPTPSAQSIRSSGSVKAKRGSRLSSGTTNSYRSSKTPSLLNGNGDGKSILSAEGRDPEASPPQSRSSSAQGSCSTSATTFEEGEDAAGASKPGSKSKEPKGNVIVSVRVRPDGSNDAQRASSEFTVDGRKSFVAYGGKEGGDYYYDNVFTMHEHNARVYDSAAKRLVRRVMEGYHGTVFAYGMTGTGKTFSMQGTASSPGVIPLAITDIFSFIRETPHREFLLRVSYLEIYNEKIHDLLSASAGNASAAAQEEIKLREDSKRGIYATPLKEEIVQSPTQLLRVIARGDHARRTGSTQFNTRSSRSHAVVQIVVESRERLPPGALTQDKRSGIVPGGVRVSTLSLIDLAGSERAADDKERRTEGAHINKSLLTLGTIISRLSDNKDKNGNQTDRDGRHLPYRDSKLTRLLQPALTGNSLVSILCTIQLNAPGSAATANSHSGETLNTLKFAARAKNNIVSHAKRAEEALGAGGDGGSRVLLERYRMEIQTLRGQLESQTQVQAEKEIKIEEQQFEKESQVRHEEQVLEMQLARTALKERIEHLNRLILSSKSTGVNSQGSLSALGRLSRMSATESRPRSLRSSASQSTLSAYGRSSLRPGSLASINSVDPSANLPFANGPFGNDDDDDTVGEFADGKASLHRQVSALQADLGDKNRYISTLERRLLQARRSSNQRNQTGAKAGTGNAENPDPMTIIREKDIEINEMRQQLDDKDRMLAALRSAARHRDLASVASDAKEKSDNRSSENGSGSPASDTPAAAANSEMPPPPPPKDDENEKDKDKDKDKDTDTDTVKDTVKETVKDTAKDKDKVNGKENGKEKGKNVDEVSKMLDEMIQDRVESGQLIKGSRGSVRVASDGRRASESLPGNNTHGLSPAAILPGPGVPQHE